MTFPVNRRRPFTLADQLAQSALGMARVKAEVERLCSPEVVAKHQRVIPTRLNEPDYLQGDYDERRYNAEDRDSKW